MQPAQLLIEKGLAELSVSDLPNDQAFCAAMASLLHAWSQGNASDYLHRLRLVENRHSLFLASGLLAVSLN